jgi:predicted nucleic acid-binding Zn ribbon protein
VPDDPQDPDNSDMDQDEGDEFAETEQCPLCGEPVYEQAEVCPNCGQYISEEDSSPRKPLWIVMSVGICVAVILIVWVLKSL